MGNIYESCCVEATEPASISKPTHSSELVQIKHSLSAKTQQKEQLKLNWDDFELVRYLCRSEYGQVTIVKLKGRAAGKQYVMKIVEKAKIKQENLLQSNFLQAGILKQDNPFIVKILHVSQNKKNIYIVMEFITGRDLYYYLIEQAESEEKRFFHEQTVKQIVAEVILGLQFLHSKNIIYRQLKPENILCTDEGHIKLTDYALSKLQKVNQPTLTYLGNVQYTAPQMLDRTKGYNRSADLWSLGVLLYELKSASIPFKGQNLINIQKRIESGNIQFPQDVEISNDLKDLILKLIRIQPSQRLQLNQVKKHKFFQSINWSDIQQRKNETGLKQIMSRYNLRIRGQHDNPPSRMYIQQVDRSHLTTPYPQFTLPTEESFNTSQ